MSLDAHQGHSVVWKATRGVNWRINTWTWIDLLMQFYSRFDGIYCALISCRFASENKLCVCVGGSRLSTSKFLTKLFIFSAYFSFHFGLMHAWFSFSFVCLLCHSITGSEAGGVQQGDTVFVLLNQSNKHHHCLSISVSKGNISFLK